MLAQLVILLGSLVLAVVFAITTFSFPSLRQDPGGLAMFPRALCVILGGCAVIQLGLILSRPADLTAAIRSDLAAAAAAFRARLNRGEQGPATTLRRMLILFILSMAYAWLIVRLGFLLSTVLYMFALLRLLQARPVVSGVIAAAMGVGIYTVFTRILEAYVPPGIWWDRLIP